MADSEHPGVARAREYLATYAARDMASLRNFFTDDVVWHVAGKHPLSGDYRGKDSLVDYFTRVDEVTSGTIAMEVESILASDRHIAMFMHVHGTRNGKVLDERMAEMFDVEPDGRWSEFWAMADDQKAVDAFWS